MHGGRTCRLRAPREAKAVIDRAIVVVLDSVGVGELPDACDYGDVGSNTLGNTAKAAGGLALPHLERMGLGNIIAIDGVPPAAGPSACFGKMGETSAAKDSDTGHWELMGLVTIKPHPTYPDGFPAGIMDAFEAAIGRKTLGNYPASGTEIIRELGEEHVRTGRPIVYTSADSVFQIAAHEDVVPVGELYEMCSKARGILTGRHSVGRVIARPFLGGSGSYTRTPRRRDFSLPPHGKTVLDWAAAAGLSVLGVGKIDEIFSGRGLAGGKHTEDNEASLDLTLEYMDTLDRGMILANLVDFDMLWGHRNDAAAYAAGLERFDRRLPELVGRLRPSDVLVVTADHGCDPTTASTDHSREYVPVLIQGEALRSGVDLGTRASFADLGKTLTDLLGFVAPVAGESFADSIVSWV